MGKIRIVVDSAADFAAPSILNRYNIIVVPQRIDFGMESYLERVEMDAEAFSRYISRDEHARPKIISPTVEQYTNLYTRLAMETDKVISLHHSRGMGNSWENAKIGAQAVMGRCDVAVIDSKTTSAGLGLLAELAAQAIEKGDSYDDVVKMVRGAVSRIYSVFYVDTLKTIQHHELLGEAQSIIGTMLGIKPFLTIEDGALLTMEKVRSRAQAIDKLVEYVGEFTSIEKLVIVQNSPFTTEAVRILQDRLAAQLSRRNFPTVLYGPTLASYLGPDGTGLFVLESEEVEEEDEEGDDF